MPACELKRDHITRYCLFAIDDASDLSMLPTSVSVGSGDLIKSTRCCIGSLATSSNGTTYRLNGANEWVVYTPSGGGGGGGGGGLSIHICAAGEYDAQTGVPTIANPSTTTIYMVPSNAGDNDAYDEWIYINSSWERLGSGNSITGALTDLSDVTVQDASTNQALVYDTDSDEWKNVTLNSVCLVQDGQEDFILDGGNAINLV